MPASPRDPARDESKPGTGASGNNPPPSKPAGKAAAKPAAGPHAKPAAGPHADPALTDPAKTPGTGALPDPHRPNEDATSG
ncbi:hypothetical protein [Roseixanthobacter liquoris]|uniref:hypothetical protein n=1 Tax=Roseixanthobacter liquoris TaxID=3119921 RepID=UPI00372A3AD2